MIKNLLKISKKQKSDDSSDGETVESPEVGHSKKFVFRRPTRNLLREKKKVSTKRVSGNNNSSRVPKFFNLLTPILISVIVVFGVIFGLIKVPLDKVVCRTKDTVCSQDLTNLINSQKTGTVAGSYFHIKKEIQKSALVDSHVIRFMFPNSLLIEVIEREPSYAVTKSQSEHSALIDESGVIIEYNSQSNLPQLVSYSLKGAVGEKIDTKSLDAIEWLELLSTNYGITSIELKEDGIYFSLDGYEVIIDSQSDKEYVLGVLEIIISRLKQRINDPTIDTNTQYQQIDLRYNNPILR